MQVRLLGPLDTMVRGVVTPVPGPRRKAILAVLALNAGRPVSADLLIDVVWDGSAPPSVVATLHNHISRLRRLFGDPAAIRTGKRGWSLNTQDVGGPVQPTDAKQAEALIRRSDQLDAPDERVRTLRRALDLWRGATLAEMTDSPWFDEQARRLERLRLRARHSLIEAGLALGEHVTLITELQDIAGQNPYDEASHAQLIRALYGAGRQADALEAFHRLRQALDDDLGIVPSRQLRELETAILRQDPSIDPPARTTVSAGARPKAPAQLPPSVAAFAGRADELAHLDLALGVNTDTQGPPPAGICAITGTAGIGKTTLAIHWAHHRADRFPDGQLYLNLRGFDPVGLPLSPDEAICLLLDGIGVPAARVPEGLQARVALFRSILAGRRVLLVLDNARDTEQIRPLLPGAAGCRTIVTSRDPLTPLVATHGATSLTVGLLDPDAARDLISQRLGRERVDLEWAAANEIIERCSGLPLALAIVAALAATRPHRSLAMLVADLRDAAHTLDTLNGGDHTTDLRAVFSCSYRLLGAAAARLFRLAGLHPGPDFTVPAAASLAGVPVEVATVLLGELADANLVTRMVNGRYGVHDLLRTYAAELVGSDDSHQDRQAARQRMFEHYLQVASAAGHLLDPYDDLVGTDARQEAAVRELPEDADAAASWFTAEHGVLAASVGEAARTGFEPLSWRLARALVTYLLRRGQWSDLETTQQTALAAVRRTGDRWGQAHALNGLALGYARSGRFDESEPLFLEAVGLFEVAGELYSQGRVYSSLAWLAERRGQPDVGLQHALSGLALFQSAGHETGAAVALSDAGWCLALLGDLDKAVDYCTEALALFRKVGYRDGEGAALDSLAYIHHQRGDLGQAVSCYRDALEIIRELGDRYNEALTLNALGDVYAAAGDAGDARATRELALDILIELDHPDAEDIREKLHPSREDG